MSNKAEQNSASKAITEIKEQVQLAQWQQQIKEKQNTGLSIAAFCEQQGISKSAYYYRLRRVREHICRVTGMFPEEMPEATPEQQQIVPIRATTERVTEGRIEIVCGEIRISFVGETTPSELKAVVEALRSC